jgi:hypothetical protein
MLIVADGEPGADAEPGADGHRKHDNLVIGETASKTSPSSASARKTTSSRPDRTGSSAVKGCAPQLERLRRTPALIVQNGTHHE